MQTNNQPTHQQISMRKSPNELHWRALFYITKYIRSWAGVESSHSVFDPLASLSVSRWKVSYLFANFSLFKTGNSTQVFSEFVHKLRNGSVIDFFLDPIFVSIKVVMQNSQCFGWAFLVLSIFDSLIDFESENAERKCMKSISIAEFTRMSLSQFLYNLPPLDIKIVAIRA